MSAVSAASVAAPAQASSAPNGAGVPVQPTALSNVALTADAGVVAAFIEYPKDPCDQFANDFQAFTGCWSHSIESVQTELNDTIAAEKKRGAVNSATAALLHDEDEADRT